MHFKLIVALTEDSITDKIVTAARDKGATGSTVIASARGEGMQVAKTFLGLSLETQRDVILLLVEEHMCRDILETIANTGDFDSNPGSGIAFSIDVEDAVGVSHQVSQLSAIVGVVTNSERARVYSAAFWRLPLCWTSRPGSFTSKIAACNASLRKFPPTTSW